VIGVRGEHGFSLIEVLVAMAISVVVFGATLTLLDAFQRQSQADQLRNETQDSARNAIDRISLQLRNVAAPTAGAFGALEQATPYSLAFQTVDPTQAKEGATNKSGLMRVRYCLNDTTPSNEVLWTQVKRWQGTAPALPASTSCPDLAASDWDSSSQLVQHVTNRIGGQERPLFIYSASSVTQIVSMESNLFLDLNPGSRPGEAQLTSGVSLRNANRQPIVGFTATQVNGHVLLNASESRDPDGLALTYKWKDGGTVLPSTGQQYETEKFASKSTHTFTLEVTNPGGLSNSTSKTVTIL
jgi:prepilin-type N-terminal cleavage/methylation domain-containing protein